MKLSIIAPVFNEGKIIEKFNNKVIKELDKIKVPYEIIYINDGSSDDSLEKLRTIVKDTNNKVISFSRNFGKESAMYAGLKNSIGEYVVIIDTDLQQNPKYIIDMYKVLETEKDIDAVCMCQKKRKEFFLISFLKKLGYKVLDRLTDVTFVSGASDFRMLRRNVVNSILLITEKNRFSKGIFSWVGFNTKYLEYDVEKRQAGKTSWSFRKLFSYGINGLVGFSTKPLNISTYIGFLTSFIAFIYFVIIVLETIITGKDIPGYASLICVSLFFSGIQLLCLGILGKYLAKTYIESKDRPIYIEKERINFDDKKN